MLNSKYAHGKNPSSHPANTLSNILTKFNKNNGCWEWQGHIDRLGYGRSSYQGKSWKAHRLVYTLLVGQIPTAKELDHLCKNTKCVNPSHLEPVSHKINTLRSNSPTAMNARKTHCKKGHELKGDNLRLRKRRNATERICILCNKERSSTWYRGIANASR